MRSTFRNFLSSIYLAPRQNISTTSHTTDHIMVIQGVGSISSPIVISDDEDEALIDLQLRVDSDSADGDYSDRPLTPSNGNSEVLSTASKGYAMALNMGYCPGRGLGRGLDGRVEPVCLEVGQKRKRADSGIGFQRSQRHAPGWPLRKGDGKLNKKRRKEHHTLGAPSRVFRSHKDYALQHTSLAAQVGPANTNQGPWAALASSSKGKERGRLMAPTSSLKSTSTASQRLLMPPQGPRSKLPYSPALPTASPPKGPRSWLASQAQSPPLAPPTPPIAPRTPPTAPRAMQQQQQHLTSWPSAIASPVLQPGIPQVQSQPTSSSPDGQSIAIPTTPLSQRQQQGVVYNTPFAGAPITYCTEPESSEPWHMQYSMVTVTAPQPPPTCFIAYPNYSNPGAYTYVPVSTGTAGYASATAAVDPYVVSAATGQTPLSGVAPVTADASTSTAGSASQSDEHQLISVTDPDHEVDRSGSSTPESSSHKKLLAERMRKPKYIAVIGHAPEADPNSKSGTYTKSLASQPNPACTLVLDNIPTRFRNPSWVHKWAVNAGEAELVCVDVDSKKGKALVEFVGAASARKAFQSKQLKGKGKHVIRAWWYRVTGVGSNAGVGEIEEGEVEDGSTKKSEPIARLSKNQKKKLQRKQQVALNPQACSSAAQVVASEDTAVDQRAHIPSTKREEAFLDAKASRRRRFSFDDFSVRFEMSTGGQDDVGVGDFIQEDDAEDHSSVASSSTWLPISRDNRGDVDMSSAVMTSRMPGDPLPASEVYGDERTLVDPLPNSVCMDVDSAVTFADNGPVLASDIEATRPQQQDINAAQVPAVTPILGFTEGTPSCSPTDLLPSLFCTEEALDENSGEPAKVVLLSGEKETEETIDSGRCEQIVQEIVVVNPLVSCTLSSSYSQPPTPLAREASVDKIALEMNLRRLVRESKQNKANAPSATASPTSSHVTTLPRAPFAVNDNVSVAQPSLSVSPATSLEDLAVSFISETIESIKPTIVKTCAPLNTRDELLQKQLKLEQYISQSKELIASLSRAQSKEEKENIMCAMREWSRVMELDSVGAEERTCAVVTTSRFCWPCSCEETVLVISDDEEE